MPRYILSAVAVGAATASVVLGQSSTFPATPLASKHYAYPSEIPYRVDTDTNLVRGQQFGFNICNSTTQNQDSNCQTSFLNALDDFCLWAPSKQNSVIADTEGEEVAWCTKPGKGTRVIPPGALQGVQFMRTSDYIQVVGFIDQTKINIQGDDFGGELDPHGADLRGNPMGSLVYSNGFPASHGDNNTYIQAIEWHNFMGGSAFCFKVCDPAGTHAADYCQHIFDRIGCAYNAPNNAQKNVFEACEGENQDFPGVYTQDGQVKTYTQPPESLGAIATMPYTARVPSSSNCVTYSSDQLYASAASFFASISPSATATGSNGAKPTGGSANGSSNPSRSSSGNAAQNTSNGAAFGARSMGETGAAAGAVIAFMGVLASMALL